MSLMQWMFRLSNAIHPRVYRWRGGQGVDRVQGSPLLLLTTTGRKTGRQHTVTVSYLPDGDDLLVIGSAGGEAAHPAWALNLRDRPDAEVQLGRERFRVRAEWAGPDEQPALWKKVTTAYPFFGGYQEKAGRTIPVIRLRRAPAA